jgi:hypothetical protein
MEARCLMREQWPDRTFCNFTSTIGTPSVNRGNPQFAIRDPQ